MAAAGWKTNTRERAGTINTSKLADSRRYLSLLRRAAATVADGVDRTHDRVHFTRNGRQYVVLISAEDLESLEATIELLSDPAAMARIGEAEAAFARGEGTSAEDMALLMAQRRARERTA